MSDGCAEERRMSCAGCPKYCFCEKTKETSKALDELLEDERIGDILNALLDDGRLLPDSAGRGSTMIIKEWEHAGMTCALRHGVFGAPCGYVALPEGHRLHGKDAWTAEGEVDVHGGITFAGKLDSDDSKRFWVSFDMAHYHDFDPCDYTRCIRTDEECIAETNRLAEQLAEMEVER